MYLEVFKYQERSGLCLWLLKKSGNYTRHNFGGYKTPTTEKMMCFEVKLKAAIFR